MTKGRYTDEVWAYCYELLPLNVGVDKVQPIIHSVLRNFVHEEVEKLPSYVLMCQMIIEVLTIVHAQLPEKLTESSPGNILVTDRTTNMDIITAPMKGIYFTVWWGQWCILL